MPPPPGVVAPPSRTGPPLPPPKVRQPPPPPPGSCQPDEVRRIPGGSCAPSCPRPDVQIGGRCCPVATLAANAECSNSACPVGQTAIGPSNFCCDSSHVYTGSGGAPACCAGAVVNGRCEPPKPPACPPGGPVTAQCPCPTRLHPSRRRVLPFEQRHLGRSLLPAGAGAGTAKGRLRADPAHSDRPSLLCRGPYPDSERRMLPARERDDDRGLLLATARSVQSSRVPGAHPEHSGLRCRLREDAGRELLQPALRQRRRTLMPRRPASLRSGRGPQCSRSL